jgi:nitroreductase
VTNDDQPTPGTSAANASMSVEEAIRSRRTHKLYEPEPVPREELEELLEIARWAPNHHLTNPWRFRVIGPRALDRLKQAEPDGAGKLDRAPTLVACSVVQRGDELQDEEDRYAAACAVYAVMLAAHGRGIASYWRTPKVLRKARGRKALGIGGDEHVLGLLHLGRGARDWAPPPRADPADYASFLD